MCVQSSRDNIANSLIPFGKRSYGLRANFTFFAGKVHLGCWQSSPRLLTEFPLEARRLRVCA
jgi:hypothetical protein